MKVGDYAGFLAFVFAYENMGDVKSVIVFLAGVYKFSFSLSIAYPTFLIVIANCACFLSAFSLLYFKR